MVLAAGYAVGAGAQRNTGQRWSGDQRNICCVLFVHDFHMFVE